MKTTFYNTALLISLLSISSLTLASSTKDSTLNTINTRKMSTQSKKLEPVIRHQLQLDVLSFCNYLQTGRPKKVEGLYQSPDGRYVIALIKNNKKGHDYIGVVCTADNPYWKRGEVKFNFVLRNDNKLEGYYYNSSGNYVPVSFSINGDSLLTNRLIKVNLENNKATVVAWL
jgi:hypothetical protein